MKVLDKVKKVFSKKKADNSIDYTAEDAKLIEMYKELEKEGFHISTKRQYMGTFLDLGDSFGGYDVTTTLFQNGVMVVKNYAEKEFLPGDVEKQDRGLRIIVSKNEKGEIVVNRNIVKVEEKPNIDMRCTDTIVTINGKTINMDSKLDRRNITPEFEFCYKNVMQLEETAKLYEDTQKFFKEVIDGVEKGSIKAKIQAKCVCVDARQAKADQVGTKFTVWSHGKVEKEITVKEDTVFLTTLDKNGNAIIDEKGNTNTYDMPLAKFSKKYKKHENGHYVQDTTPMVTIQLPDSMIPENGKKLLPPCWGGYDGTLMRGGLVMLPFNPELSREKQIEEWKKYLNSGANVDWYPNNEAETYATCDRDGVFKDADLRELYGQTKTDEHTI